MKIKDKQEAIDFVANDIYGKQIRLSDFRGKKIHLGFFRNVNCPFCNLRVHQLSKLNTEFEEKGLRSIYFFESDAKLLLRSTFHRDISPIPLVGDPEKRIYKQYGVETSVIKMMRTLFTKDVFKDMTAGKKLNLPGEKDESATQSLMPADFLIDENFKIYEAHYGKNLNDHINIEEIKQFAGM